MKNNIRNLFLSIGLSSLFSTASAAVLCVNNSTNGPAAYTDITVAMAAASNNDTLFISGSINSYGDILISKPLTFIGAGANPQKQIPYSTIVGNVNMANGLNNVRVKGLIINGYFNLGYGATNFDMEYCYFMNSHFQLNNNCSNIRISSCIFANVNNGANRNIDGFDYCGGYYTSTTNLLIQNCIFNGAISGLNIPGTLIQNNIFLSNVPAFYGVNVYNNGGCYTTSYINNASIQNNIFYRADPLAYTSGCAFSNNISYSSSTTFGNMPGTGNLDNIDSQFINFPAAGDYFSYAYDFHLGSSSPGHNAGTDGKDIGVYGGTFATSLFGEVNNVPVLRQVIVTNPNIAPNGNINVKVRSTIARTN